MIGFPAVGDVVALKGDHGADTERMTVTDVRECGGRIRVAAESPNGVVKADVFSDDVDIVEAAPLEVPC